MDLQAEFGFEYAAAIGSLIYLMNTFIKTTFAIRKLAKFMQYPGRKHFKYLRHLLYYILCNRCSAGIKFYSDRKLSPLTQLLKDRGYHEYAELPLIVLCDSSFQDCPDTCKSTAGFMIMLYGTCIEHWSGTPSIISQSTCEAEYCTFSLALMGAAFCRKLFNEFQGYDPDRPLTIPLGVDAQSAIDTARSSKETGRTRHIARRFHYVRLENASGRAVLFKIEGEVNPSDSLTKVLSGEALDEQAKVYQVDVDP